MASRLATTRELPVLDTGPFLAGAAGAVAPLAAQLRHLCEAVGFFFVRNHGVAPDLIDRMFAETRRFHGLPMAEKLKLKINEHQRGYIQPKATLVRHSTYNQNTKLDTNETVVFATAYPADDANGRAGKRFYGANQWPAGLPGFRAVVEEYMAE